MRATSLFSLTAPRTRAHPTFRKYFEQARSQRETASSVPSHCFCCVTITETCFTPPVRHIIALPSRTQRQALLLHHARPPSQSQRCPLRRHSDPDQPKRSRTHAELSIRLRTTTA